MAPPKVYGLGGSTGRVLIALFEKGVEDVEVVPVSLQTNEHKNGDFLKLQPFGAVPVYQDEDVTLFESRAIVRYIAERYAGQGTPLYGESSLDRAMTDQWLEVEAQNFSPVISKLVSQLLFAKYLGQDEPDARIVEENSVKLEAVLDVYEEHLSRHKYLAGDFFSLADLSHISSFHFLVNVAARSEPVTSRKHVDAWWQDISSRPSWRKVQDLFEASM